MENEQLVGILEGALFAAGEPLSIQRLLQLFAEDEQPSIEDMQAALAELQESYQSRAIRLKEMATGYCFVVAESYSRWVSHLWEEKPQRYSRALMETLAIIAYRQPITRSEIEDIRGVAVSTDITKKLLDREWIRIVGHKDVPGRPALYATTRQFLENFSLKNLDELPPLAAIVDLDAMTLSLIDGEVSMQSAAPLVEQEELLEEDTAEMLLETADEMLSDEALSDVAATSVLSVDENEEELT